MDKVADSDNTEIGIGLHAKAKGKPALDSDRGTEEEERR
jgi:hypothetical protein